MCADDIGRPCDREEDRGGTCEAEIGVDAEFLPRLPYCGVERVFTGFDVSTRGGEPHAGSDVVDEEDTRVSRIDHDDVGHEVLRRDRRLASAGPSGEDLITHRQPRRVRP